MCRGVIYRGKFARGQGELAKLLGEGDWKRGKKLIQYKPGNDDGFQFDTCLCVVDVHATAAAVGCTADDGDCHADEYLFTEVKP